MRLNQLLRGALAAFALSASGCASTVRLDNRYGSDHYPLMTMLEFETAGRREPSVLPRAVPSSSTR